MRDIEKTIADAREDARMNHIDWLKKHIRGFCTEHYEQMLAAFVEAGGADELHPELGDALNEFQVAGRMLAGKAERVMRLLNELHGRAEAARLRSNQDDLESRVLSRCDTLVFDAERQEVLKATREILANSTRDVHEKPFTIIVNGTYKTVPMRTISYDELLDLAKMSGDPTCLYKRGVNNVSGSLLKGQVIALRDEMIFNLAHTGNA